MHPAIKRFFILDTTPSLIFLGMMSLGMLVVNTSLKPLSDVFHTASADIIINDLMMSLFFLVIGIEIKLEIKKDSASNYAVLLLPVAAALGGIAVPAAIYAAFNRGGSAMQGWAVPTATDIAFSLGILSLFSRRVPSSLRLFLMSVAIFDDLMAIAIIAIYYSQGIAWGSFAFSCGCVVLLVIYNRYIKRLPPYIFAGCALWIGLFDCGIHPAISGAILGILMPREVGERVLRFLHIPVAFVVVPLFVFVNSGVPLAMLSSHIIMNSVSLGVAGGLFIGKQCGIFVVSTILIKLGWAKLPYNASWGQLYAVSVLCGTGFTMSLVISSLAFTSEPYMLFSRAGVVTGSLASVAFGIICMALSRNCKNVKP